MPPPRSRAPLAQPPPRDALLELIGGSVARFQEASHRFDELAAEILAVDRNDLPCMTALLMDGAASPDALARSLRRRPQEVRTTVGRLELAGYVRRVPGTTGQVELTEHARDWIERIWAPLWVDGQKALSAIATRDLAVLAAFMPRACSIQEDRGRKLRAWLTVRSSPARRPHLRGGLSPAALRRVQLYVEAHLARPIRLADLAERASLSPYHFARAFKISTRSTPLSFVEGRRVERARKLLVESTLTLAEIAHACGLGAQSRLTSVFKRHTGFTPGAYRRGHAPA